MFNIKKGVFMSFFDEVGKNNSESSDLKKELDANEVIKDCAEDVCEETEECTKKDEIKEITNYTNDKNAEALNGSLASVVEMFDKANKNVIIHKLKVSVGSENEDEIGSLIKEQFDILTARIEELEVANRERVNRVSEISNSTKEAVEASLLATKRELLSNLKDATKSSGVGGYVLTAIFTVAATSAFFLKDSILAIFG
jgi:flagellin-specific chaperone FliS